MPLRLALDGGPFDPRLDGVALGGGGDLTGGWRRNVDVYWLVITRPSRVVSAATFPLGPLYQFVAA